MDSWMSIDKASFLLVQLYVEYYFRLYYTPHAFFLTRIVPVQMHASLINCQIFEAELGHFIHLAMSSGEPPFMYSFDCLSCKHKAIGINWNRYVQMAQYSSFLQRDQSMSTMVHNRKSC